MESESAQVTPKPPGDPLPSDPGEVKFLWLSTRTPAGAERTGEGWPTELPASERPN